MKEVTYEEWIKNPTPRIMWVWEDDVKDMVKRKVVYVIKGGPRKYPVRVTTNDDTDYEAYRHCAEIEEPEPKTRRMTHKELSRWLRENPTREFVDSKGSKLIFCYHTYSEAEASKEVPKVFLIRENDGEWREPLVEEE